MNSIFDWIGREWGALLGWWALTVAASIAIFPLMFRFARALPSRGYTLSRAAGILIISFVYWELNIFGVLRNTPGNAALVALLVFVISLVVYFTWKDREPILPWLRSHLGLILATELVFLVAFFGWSFIRSMNPEQASTEKPMEMAFLSSSRRSAAFPPNDPWMSGYAISYYHFGYIILGIFANLTGVSNGLAFGIASGFLFGLTAVGAFGVAFDLVAARLRRISAAPYMVGLVAVVLVLLMGNLGAAAIEYPYQTKAMPDAYFQFMDIKERNLTEPTGCPQTGQFPPNCGWWWFNLTRIIRDRDMKGNGTEIIDEFPAFSFILSDIHPHVLSLPFVILAIGLMLNLVLTGRGAHPWEFLIYAICIGGLIFLNSWDAVFLGMLVGAEALRRLIKNGTGWLSSDDWLRLFAFAVITVVTVGLLYLPFFISFRSQAGSPVPNLIYPTRIQQFLVMFGTFTFILVAYLFFELIRAGNTFNGRLAGQIILFVLVFAAAVLVLGMAVAWSRDDLRAAVFQVVDQAGGLGAAIPAVIVRRLQGIPLLVLLAGMVYLVVGRLFARAPRGEQTHHAVTYAPSTGFVLLMIGMGTALALLPEFTYVLDNFGTRINMIFKMYYQTWALWGIASAFALWSILVEVTEKVRINIPVRIVVTVVSVVLILAGLIYTPAAVYSHMVQEGGHTLALGRLSLDGSPMLVASPEDQQAAACLQSTVTDDSQTLVESMQEVAYNRDFGRIAAITGIPTLLGWPNHERQWRGNTYGQIAGTRLEDIDRLYTTGDMNEAQQIIKKYGIDYVYVGSTERQVYAASGGLNKFTSLPAICQYGNAAAYPTNTMFNSAVTPPTAGG